MKSNKSFLKRLKVTKRGKIVARRPGQDHFNAKSSGRGTMARKRTGSFNMTKKAISRFLP